jgi:hypothetical protein
MVKFKGTGRRAPVGVRPCQLVSEPEADQPSTPHKPSALNPLKMKTTCLALLSILALATGFAPSNQFARSSTALNMSDVKKGTVKWYVCCLLRLVRVELLTVAPCIM